MPDIFLRTGAESPSDVKLGDPTVVISGAPGTPIYSGSAPPRIRQVYYQTRSEPPYLVPTPIAIGVPVDMGGTLPSYQSIYVQTKSEPPYLPQISATVSSLGWQPALSQAPFVVPVRAGFSSVPFNTAQLSINYTDFSWYGPLSTAPPIVKAQAGYSFAPFDTAQVSLNFTDFNWQQPLSTAPATASTQLSDWQLPYTIVTAVTADQWQPALSAALPLPKAQAGFSSVPFIPQPDRSIGWQSPLSVAVASSNFAGTDYSLPVYTIAADNNVTIDKWQPALSAAQAVTKAKPGFSSVPFNTAQRATAVAAPGIPIYSGSAAPRTRVVYYKTRHEPPYRIPDVSVVYTGIPIDMGGALPQVQSTYYQATFVPPYYIAPAATIYTILGWHQPLSSVVSFAKAQQGFSSIPFNTAQQFNYTSLGWHQPLSTPTKITIPQAGIGLVPFNITQVTPAVSDTDRIVKFIGNVGHMMLR